MPQRAVQNTDESCSSVDGFALHALSVIIEQNKENSSQTRLVRPLVAELYEAVAGPDIGKAPAVIDLMLNAGIPAETISDTYIPAVAQKLGDAWCADNMDWAKVSIGSARLQGLLRHLGPEWCRDTSDIGNTEHACLVVVPEHAQHTLGATILAGQMRRKGIAVRLELDCAVASLPKILSHQRFNAVFLSATTRESLDVLRRIVQNIRQTGRNVPVIVGGNVLSQDYDVKTLVGADLATCDLDEALEFCGLSATKKVMQSN